MTNFPNVKEFKPLIGTSTTVSISATASDTNGAKILNTQPASELNVASAFFHNDGNGGAVVVTVKFQLYSGVDWGTLHTCVDSNGDNVTFTANVDEDVEVNMYAQPEWKENMGWRIVLSPASSTAISGTAVAVIR